MEGQEILDIPWLKLHAWLMLDSSSAEDEGEAQPIEDFVYHRPVLLREVLELLKPKPGLLIVDGTCGGGGHTEALLESGAHVLALDQDPDSVQHVSERLAHFGRSLIVRQANFRHAASFLTLASPLANWKMHSAVSAWFEAVPSTCEWTREQS
jgi:2-polyprenyl-3-methyl-5-hydroxy-6-metoxy-1,4-benzoquinol methylase